MLSLSSLSAHKVSIIAMSPAIFIQLLSLWPEFFVHLLNKVGPKYYRLLSQPSGTAAHRGIQSGVISKAAAQPTYPFLGPQQPGAVVVILSNYRLLPGRLFTSSTASHTHTHRDSGTLFMCRIAPRSERNYLQPSRSGPKTIRQRQTGNRCAIYIN